MPTLSGSEKSYFLLKTANEGQDDLDSTIYMKSVLSVFSYGNFKAAASYLEEHKISWLTDTILELNPPDRTGFLEAATVAKEDTKSFLFLYNNVISYQDQKNFLEISSSLGNEKRGAFVRNTVKSGKDALTFIDLSKKIIEDDFTGHMFENFLFAANHTKNSKELKSIVDFSGELNKTQKDVFFNLASQQKYGRNLPGLINFASSIINEPNRPEISLELREEYIALDKEDAYGFFKPFHLFNYINMYLN